MQLFVELALFGFAVPLAVAWLVQRVCLAVDPLRPLAATCGLASAFAVGGWLLPWLPLFQPDMHWHWLPAVTITACLLSGILETVVAKWSPASDDRRKATWLPVGLSAVVAAWLVVPDWERLSDVRLGYAAGLAVAIIAIGCICQHQVRRLQRLRMPDESTEPMLNSGFLPARNLGLKVNYMLSAIALTASLLMFLAESAKFAQLGGILFAATLSWLAIGWMNRTKVLELGPAMAGYTVALLGLLLCGYLNSWSGVPWGCYALVAISPLCILLVVGPRIPAVVYRDESLAKEPPIPFPFTAMFILHVILASSLSWAALSAAPAEW